MRRAWGDRPHEERRRIVAAARIFGRQFEKQLTSQPPVSDERDTRRLLMAVINASIQEFAELEGIDQEAAGEFLGDVGTRDLILEFNEVLEAYGTEDTGKSLDELLQEAVDSRIDKARWADHWSSG